MNKDTAFIQFSIVADEWPIDKFTEELGIKPTEEYKKGDSYIRGKRKSTRFETVWEIDTGMVELLYDDDEDKQIFESLIAPLKSKIELINNYRKQYHLTCIFFVHYIFYDAQTPGMRLDPSVISFANNIEAIIDVYIDNKLTLEDEELF